MKFSSKLFFSFFIFGIFLQIFSTKEESFKTTTNITPTTTQKIPRKIMKLERNGNNHKELMDILVINGMINKKTYQPKDLQILLEGFSETFFANLKKAQLELKYQTEQFKLIRTKMQTKIECLENEMLQGKQFLIIICLLLFFVFVMLVFANICFIKHFMAKFNKNGFKHVRMTVGGDGGEMEQI